MTFCRDCSIRIPDPANTESCSESCPTPTPFIPEPTGWPHTEWPTYEPCLHKTCLVSPPYTPSNFGVPDPPANRCSEPQNRAPQPAPQTTLNHKSGATDFERLLHMSILFYEAQVRFKVLCLNVHNKNFSALEHNQILIESHGEVIQQWMMVVMLEST